MDNSIFGNPVGIPHRGPVYEGTLVSAPELNSVALCMASARENRNMELIDAKVGDLYYNTSEYNLYQCVQVNVTTSPRTCTSSWLCISLGPVQNAIAEAISNKADKSDLDNKEDKANRIDDLKVPNSELIGKYPSALAVSDLCTVLADGIQHETALKLAEKADKSQIGDIETALDNIIAIQNSLIGGDDV